MGLADEWIASYEDPERCKKEMKSWIAAQIARENASPNPGKLGRIEIILRVYDDEPRDDDDMSVDDKRDAEELHRLVLAATAEMGLGDFRGRIRIVSHYYHEKRPTPNGRQLIVKCGFLIPDDRQ